jgi:hypothetical protein
MSDYDEYGVAIVDRIEGDVAVLEMIEPTFTFEFPVELLPDGIEESNAVEVDFKERPEIQEAREEEIQQLQDELMEKPDDE